MTKNIRKKKSPGRRTLIHKVKTKRFKAHCRICGTLLHTNTLKTSKSGKHAARPYGGEICHACLKTSIQAIEPQ
jgi:ribosomal protein L34E